MELDGTSLAVLKAPKNVLIQEILAQLLMINHISSLSAASRREYFHSTKQEACAHDRFALHDFHLVH